MKNYLIILLFTGLAACSSPSGGDPAADKEVSLQMSAVGIYNFRDYIHSLTVYAFVRSSEGYFFHKVLAEFDSLAISNLVDGNENSKLLKTLLPLGDYDLYFVANTSGNYTGMLQPGVSVPSDIFLTYPVEGLKREYFLGNVKTRILAGSAQSIPVVLKRVVSKLVVTLYNVPSVIDTVRLSIGNISDRIGIDGTIFSGDVIRTSATFAHDNNDVYTTDTVVYQMLTFPTVIGGTSDLDIVFLSKSGQEKTKTVSALTFLPDKFVRVVGKINDSPSGLLNYKVEVILSVTDSWQERTLPDFSLKSNTP